MTTFNVTHASALTMRLEAVDTFDAAKRARDIVSQQPTLGDARTLAVYPCRCELDPACRSVLDRFGIWFPGTDL